MADDQERVSLDPLKPVEALKALLKVDPDDAPADADEAESAPKSKKKPRTKKRAA